MNQERKLSFFLPPISPVKDANGKNVTPATLVPHKELTLEEVWNIVTGSPRLKKLTEAAAAAYGDEKEYRRLKQSTSSMAARVSNAFTRVSDMPRGKPTTVQTLTSDPLSFSATNLV